MNKIIGIRHEDKYEMERRVAIPPKHASQLIKKHKLEIIVEKSAKRIFEDAEYEKAGALLSNDLSKAPVVFGVKEMPLSFFEEGKTYIFFSHVIKGQSYNMPMLKKMIEKKCTLIDYEKIIDEQNRRLIFFGKFAGLAGMINSLWSLGQRLKVQGIETPFVSLKQSHKYQSLDEAKEAISKAGMEIVKNGLPKEICPLTIGFTGYGNVSMGAQEISHLLPIKEISPEELLELQNKKDLPTNVVYKVVFKEEHLSTPITFEDMNMMDRFANPQNYEHDFEQYAADSKIIENLKKTGEEFDLQDYYDHPELYKNNFEQYVPHLTVLMNCMYWDGRYPRIITKDYLEQLYKSGEPKLKVIGDITCDPDGSIECTHVGTEIEDPVFVYNPFTREPKMGFDGEGLLVMSVDILPSELPRESSNSFGDALLRFVKEITIADYNVPFELLNLPAPIKKAVILHNGELTPDYEYIQQYL